MRAFLVILLLLCGCRILPQNQLDGRTWALVEYGDPANPTPLLPGSRVTMTFSELEDEAGQVSGFAGCNRFGGGYEVAYRQLLVRELEWTEQACFEPQGVMAQEVLILRAMMAVRSYNIADGILSIYYDAEQQLSGAGSMEDATGDPVGHVLRLSFLED